MTFDETPLTGPPPAEVPLTDAPLVRVIAQVRFPLVASVEKRDFIAPFQEAIRAEYPVLRPEQSRSVVLGQQGVMDARSNTVWRFHDASSAWRVTLAPDFLALETTSYTSREDFLDRLKRVLEALVTHVDPKVIDRLGVRYIDRVAGDNLNDLPQLVRPEVCGVLSTPLASHALHSISEAVFVLPESTGQVMTRWGLVPARGTVDPAAVDAIDEPSWLLDVDAFQTETRELDVEAALQLARGFAERIYSVFRWAVTDEFLRRYGGQP
ncbi:MAG: TIGR04255 family protein [Dehalococcoidia bacterium]